MVLGAWAPIIRADGGTLRLWERAGNYKVAVFTDPTPLRAGPVDVSVFVQDASNRGTCAGGAGDGPSDGTGRAGPHPGLPGPCGSGDQQTVSTRPISSCRRRAAGRWTSASRDRGDGHRSGASWKRPSRCRAGWRCGRGSAGRPWQSCCSAFIRCWSGRRARPADQQRSAFPCPRMSVTTRPTNVSRHAVRHAQLPGLRGVKNSDNLTVGGRDEPPGSEERR